MNISEYRKKIDNYKGRISQIGDNIFAAEKECAKAEEELIYAQDAQLIEQIVAQETQSQLEYHLNELVSLGMQAVFEEDAYDLCAQFELKRGRTAVDLLFKRDGKLRKPMKSTGFGQPDIASFILRPTLWSLENKRKRKRPVFFYDEPLRHLNDPTQRLHKKAADMIRNISHQLGQGIQVIMVTQIGELANAGDKTFEIRKRNNRSYIVE